VTITNPPSRSGEPVAASRPAASTEGPAPATRGEEFGYLFFVVWVLIGLCLDGWAHRYQPELESFFTPWHAVFYTGFIGGAGWLASMLIRRRPHVASMRDAVPSGYELAVLGLALFAVGGVGDGFWHTIFGVETGIDALLSPTHLVLLTGMLGGATAPVRSAWRRADNPVTGHTFRSFLPVGLAVGVATTGVAFFFLYANGFNNWQSQFTYEPNEDDWFAALGIVSTLISTVILLGPTMLLLRRWQPPFGAFTLIFGVVGVFMAGLDAFEYWWQVVAPLAGGVTADLIVGRRWEPTATVPNDPASPPEPATPGPVELEAMLRNRAWTVGLVVPLVMWSVSTVAIHLAWTIRWPPELWIGQIVMAMLTGFALALISHPPASPHSTGPHSASHYSAGPAR
jgi:hypothetical protein